MNTQVFLVLGVLSGILTFIPSTETSFWLFLIALWLSFSGYLYCEVLELQDELINSYNDQRRIRR